MTKQNSIDLQYVVEGPYGITDYTDTRAQARFLQQSYGGAKKGFRILQQFIVQREVR